MSSPYGPWRSDPIKVYGGVLDLGILILFATTVLRVLTALASFMRLGDRAFVAVTVAGALPWPPTDPPVTLAAPGPF